MSVDIWVGYPRSYTPGRVRAPQFVTLHHTAGSEGPTSAESGAQYDKTRTDGTSCHCFVDSAGPALREVPDGDRSHSAMYHGNEVGIHLELCGTLQTREQWLDPTSYATLVTAAALTREICDRHGFELRRLSVEETRAAYYGKDHRPTGINDHGTVTAAFPEDGGNHTDVGPDFPWDVFMQLVTGEGEDSDMPTYFIGHDGAEDTYWLCDGKDASGPLLRPFGFGPVEYQYPDARDEIADLKTLHAEGKITLIDGGVPREGMCEAFGRRVARSRPYPPGVPTDPAPGGVVDVSAASVAAIADAVADELHDDPERDGAGQ